MLKDQLRKARKAAKKTQKEVADHIGVTESAYCGYETGKRQPDALKIKSIAAYLQVTGDYLLETNEQREQDVTPSINVPIQPIITDDELELLNYYRGLNSAAKQTLLSTAKAFYGNPQLQEGRIQKRES